MKTLNTKAKVILVTVMMLLWVGCSDNDTTKPTVNDEPFTFLKVGNEWEYENFGGMPEDIWKIKIVSENNGYYILEYDDDESDNAIWYSNGDYWKTFNDDASIGITMLYKNCYVGQRWDTTASNGYATSKVTKEVLSISEKVTVPAGTFTRCIKVKVEENTKYTWNGEEFEIKILTYSYIHKNIGIVMMEVIEGPAPIKGVVSKLKSTYFLK